MIALAKVVFLSLLPTLILQTPRFGGGNQNTFPRKARPPPVQTSLVTLLPQTALISPWRRVNNMSLSLHSPAIYVSILYLAASS
jgi:hypothetical protein